MLIICVIPENFYLTSVESGANLLAQDFALLEFASFRFQSHFRQNPLSALLANYFSVSFKQKLDLAILNFGDIGIWSYV